MGQLVLVNNVFAGIGHAAVLTTNGKAKNAGFQLMRNSIVIPAMAVILQEDAATIDKAEHCLRIDVRENVLSQTLSFGQHQSKPADTGAEAGALLKRLVAWQEQRNAYGSNALLLFFAIRGEPIDTNWDRGKLADWNAFWGVDNTDSIQGAVAFQGGDLQKKAQDSAAALVPADFRLADGSVGKGKRSDGKDLGADVDLVGPGPAYERLKKTPEYQQWLKDTGQVSVESPFVILAEGGRPKKAVATLADAVAAAASGDVIEIRDNGPFVLQPMELKDKALTVRAGAGARPVLELALEAVQADKPLLTTKAALILEGLEFHRDVGGKPGAKGLRHIFTERAPLTLMNCRFIMRKRSDVLIHAVVAEASPSFIVRNCEFLGDWHSGPHLSWAAAGSRFVVANCTFLSARHAVGIGIADTPGPATATAQLIDNTMCGGSLAWLQIAGEKVFRTTQPQPRVRIEARRNTSNAGFVCSIFSPSSALDEYLNREHRALVSRLFALEERGNQVAPGAFLFRQSIVPNGPTAAGARETLRIVALEDWQALWKLEKTDLTSANVRFAKEDLGPNLTPVEKLTPQDFRIQTDDPGAAKIGAEVDLVGPGPAYEKWKQREEYQLWLKDSAQTK
jgi:hypothetical protein